MTPQASLLHALRVGPTEVGRVTGLAEKTVRRWGQGKPITNRVRLALAGYFGVSPEALPGGVAWSRKQDIQPKEAT